MQTDTGRIQECIRNKCRKQQFSNFKLLHVTRTRYAKKNFATTVVRYFFFYTGSGQQVGLKAVHLRARHWYRGQVAQVLSCL